ncbi:MAG TPA: PhoU domain-containing protein [Candidatus Obscuribacterales bacterium]
MVKTEAITLIKEDVLALGRMVDCTIGEITRLLQREPAASLSLVEEQEEKINQACYDIEEKCMDLLLEREVLSAQEIRTLLGATVIAAKFERMADHANRVGRLATWAAESEVDIPPELPEMAGVVHRMVQEVLLSFLTDSADKTEEILQRDNQVDYLHDFLSKRLLSELGEREPEEAQMRAQFLFGARFLERMGDACCSIAKRVYFIVTGQRFKQEA